MPLLAELIQELEQETPATRRLLERVPDKALDWSPHPKSTTLGALANHIAMLPRGIVEIAKQDTFDVTQPGPRPRPASAAELLTTLDESVAFARAELSAMTQEDMERPWRLMFGEKELLKITRGALLRTILLNHWYHHRGQLTVYLRENNVPLPAIYGPSADEMPFGLGAPARS
ncbi:MAG TPA: DinB family protein [Gemmatimonadales bacterium]|nr:DinB family protein [Gemmatimonadales bacterium]